MLSKKYRINVDQDTLPLIKFLNNGVYPKVAPELMKKSLWFLFEIESTGKLLAEKNKVVPEDDLYNEAGTSKMEYIDYTTLIG